MDKCGVYYTISNAITGPGHIPPNPHPSPNKIPPMINFLSIVPVVEGKFSANNGFLLTAFTKLNKIKLTPTAAPSTNKRAGSQVKLIYKNSKILLLFSIPEKQRPIQKNIL